MPKVHDRRAVISPINAMLRTVVVEDPYERGSHITAISSFRDDPLGRLHARGQIDEAQYQAGRRWQSLFEAAQIGGIKAMDTTKEPVDGGSAPEVLTDRQQKAIKELNALYPILGKEGSALVRDVLGNRMFMEQVADARKMNTCPDSSDMRYLGKRFRECLECLAREFNLA